MNTKVLEKLEWPKIVREVEERCQTSLGKEKASLLSPLPDFSAVQKALDETDCAMDRIRLFGSFPAQGGRDIRDSLLRLRVNAALSMKELYDIAGVLRTVKRITEYGAKREEEDALSAYFSAMEPLESFEKELSAIFISEEEMADDASAALSAIRRKIRVSESKVHAELSSLLVSAAAYLQDHVVTMRNERYCVPVKSEYRSLVPGMIHDESGSGSTVFVEPMCIVKLNNEIRLLRLDEEKEMARIIYEESCIAAGYREMLEADMKSLSALDLAFAKAAVANDRKATKPLLSRERRFTLKEARHPLLNVKSVVPIDVTLGGDFDTLIITGPNTGGKTVSLKTIGLLTVMGLSGLFIPARDGSSIAFFQEVFADIGDEQSIEQNLSTFSSHMKNLVEILKKADADSLVLLDELCAGTDPEEGAALAISIINALRKKGALIGVTTHYSELKLYAVSRQGVENGSCEFDLATLSPTYRLLIGIPGKSNAFAISSKLGLPGEIIKEAKEGLDSHQTSFEDVIRDLHHSKRQMEREKVQIKELKEEAARLQDSLASEEAKVEARKEKILSDAKKEAAAMLADAKAQLDSAIRAIHKSGNAVGDLEKARTAAREKLEKFHERKAEEPVRTSHTKAEDIRIGTTVRVLSYDTKGNVLSLPDKKGMVEVQMGIIRSKVALADLEIIRVEDAVTRKGALPAMAQFSKSLTISPEINLIGKRVDEALPLLESYLDDAYISHLPSARIVHGKGTGALKGAIWQYLKKANFVQEYRLGAFGEGDAGVTVVTFKY